MSDFFPSTVTIDAITERGQLLSEYLENINELADVLISQNVWLFKRIRELEKRVQDLENIGAGIARQPQQGQGSNQPSHQQGFNPMLYPMASFLNARHNLSGYNSGGLQQIPPIPLSSFSYMSMGP